MRHHLVEIGASVKKVARRVAHPLGEYDIGPLFRLTKAAASAGAQAVPGLPPVFAIVGEIVQMCQQVASNKRAVKQLGDRCQNFMEILQDAVDSKNPKDTSLNVDEIILYATNVLQGIRNRLVIWKELGFARAFLQQDSITSGIKESHNEITNCIDRFHLISTINIQRWQEDFEINNRADHTEILEHLADLGRDSGHIIELINETSAGVRRLEMIMQQGLSTFQENDPRRHGLEKNLRLVLEESGDLLPDVELTHGEVKITAGEPIMLYGRHSAMTEYRRGTYLGNKEIILKSLRTVVRSDPETRRRFKREADVWLRVWKQDKGRYIVPVYGFFASPEHAHMSLVYPYYPNGTALEYLRNKPYVQHIPILQHIARGLSVLHGMDIMHGDVRGASVMIDQDGNALITEFGLSKVLQDINMVSGGVPMSVPVFESIHWHAPEMLTEGVQSKASDIWAYGMTVLELLTHEKPFNELGVNMHALARLIENGGRPKRPTDEAVIKRGLTDQLWEWLMEEVWKQVPSERPDIARVVAFMNEC